MPEARWQRQHCKALVFAAGINHQKTAAEKALPRKCDPKAKARGKMSSLVRSPLITADSLVFNGWHTSCLS